MEIEKKNESSNAFYGRKECEFEIQTQKETPSRKALIEEIAKKTGSSADCVSVRKVDQNYGSKKTRVSAYIYKSKEDLAKNEPGWFAKRGLPKEKK